MIFLGTHASGVLLIEIASLRISTPEACVPRITKCFFQLETITEDARSHRW
jgi:hypothetical protein